MTTNPTLTTVASLLPALTDTVSRHRTLIGFDFDGTLSPLVDDPAQAQMTDDAAAALASLAASTAVADGRIAVALVSGRDLATLHELTSPPPGTYLIASHGAERGRVDDAGQLTDRHTLSLSPADAEHLADLSDAVTQIVEAHPQTMLESKPLSVVLHTRKAAPDVAAAAQQATLIIANEFRVPVLRGHDVIELPIVHATKGKAVAELKDALGLTAVIFGGDDITDETVLKALRPAAGDIGIKVGQADTAAQYRVADPAAVGELLQELSKALSA